MKKTPSNRKSKIRNASCEDTFANDLYAENKSSDSWPLKSLYCEHQNTVFKKAGSMDIDVEAVKEFLSLCEGEGALSWATSVLSISPTARNLLKEASKTGWELKLETLDGPDFHLDVPEKTITLNDNDLSKSAISQSSYFSSILIISLVRALRDVWQENRNGAFDEDYTPESILTLERIRAADLDVIAIMVAWELRCEGHNNIWRHILGSDDGDLAMKYSRTLEKEPASTFSHRAMMETFKQWFTCDERVSSCDHETLDYMDDVMTITNAQNPFGHKNIQKIDIERLSCLPDKTAYLQHDASDIITNPIYAGMNDEINQSHLMHILYDINVIIVQNVPFRNFDLAERIFPNGMMNAEESETIH
ncbi:MAG: DUF6782 family putative metallopeptidase [Bdellovibrionales bacterium]